MHVEISDIIMLCNIVCILSNGADVVVQVEELFSEVKRGAGADLLKYEWSGFANTSSG